MPVTVRGAGGGSSNGPLILGAAGGWQSLSGGIWIGGAQISTPGPLLGAWLLQKPDGSDWLRWLGLSQSSATITLRLMERRINLTTFAAITSAAQVAEIAHYGYLSTLYANGWPWCHQRAAINADGTHVRVLFGRDGSHRATRVIDVYMDSAGAITTQTEEFGSAGGSGEVDEIIAAKPDVMTFHGVFPDEDLYVKVLEAGINIVTTADWITGWHRDTNHPHPSGKAVSQLLSEACAKGGSTFYGTGMNPGLNQILGVVCSADVAEIENVTTIESVDVSCHHSKDTWIEVGYGLPVDDPSIPGKLEKYTRVFADSVLMMADCFGLELDEVKFSAELGACTKDVDLGWYVLPKGSLGGNYIKYQGMVDGIPRVETHLEWQMTPHTDPSWKIQGCYITQIKGDPCVYNKHMIFPKPGVDLSDPSNFASIGMTVTGMPALSAIASVVAAPPGLLTSADLPLRGFAGRFKR